MGQVVQFPGFKQNRPPQSIEEVISNIETTRREHVDMFLDSYVPFVFQRAYDEGFDLTHERCNYINSLFVESLRAALLKSVDIHHELQEFAQKSMEAYFAELDEEGEEKET